MNKRPGMYDLGYSGALASLAVVTAVLCAAVLWATVRVVGWALR